MAEACQLHVLFAVCLCGTGATTSMIVYSILSAAIYAKKFNCVEFTISMVAFVLFLSIMWKAKLIAKRSARRRRLQTFDVIDLADANPPSDYIISVNLSQNPYLVGETSIHYKDSDALEMCVVCQLDFQEHEKVIFPLECRHYFHKECITKWLLCHQICPICRRVISHGPPSHMGDDISIISIVVASATTNPNGGESEVTLTTIPESVDSNGGDLAATLECSPTEINPLIVTEDSEGHYEPTKDDNMTNPIVIEIVEEEDEQSAKDEEKTNPTIIVQEDNQSSKDEVITKPTVVEIVGEDYQPSKDENRTDPIIIGIVEGDI